MGLATAKVIVATGGTATVQRRGSTSPLVIVPSLNQYILQAQTKLLGVTKTDALILGRDGISISNRWAGPLGSVAWTLRPPATSTVQYSTTEIQREVGDFVCSVRLDFTMEVTVIDGFSATLEQLHELTGWTPGQVGVVVLGTVALVAVTLASAGSADTIAVPGYVTMLQMLGLTSIPTSAIIPAS